MRKRLWDLAKSRIEIGTILPGHRHKVAAPGCGRRAVQQQAHVLVHAKNRRARWHHARHKEKAARVGAGVQLGVLGPAAQQGCTHWRWRP